MVDANALPACGIEENGAFKTTELGSGTVITNSNSLLKDTPAPNAQPVRGRRL